ncbi:MAG: hypothetical protein IPM76_07985 [Chloroflexi bacterium]|nr:hypothetical protein [Chloroflexota bacterium]
MKKLTIEQRLILLGLLKQYFNDSELREIFFALGIDYEALPGNGKEEKAREMVLYLERREQITALLDICKRLRPQVEWESQEQANKLARYPITTGILEKLAPFPIAPVFAHAQLSELHWTNRASEIQKLTNLWHDEQSRIVGIMGLGGVGKSSLARRWYDELLRQSIQPDGVFWWSFYYQPSLDEFLEGILCYLTNNQFGQLTFLHHGQGLNNY